MGACAPESSSRRAGRMPSDRLAAMMSKPGTATRSSASARSNQRDMRPFHLCAHRRREQAVCIVDQHVEVLDPRLSSTTLVPVVGHWMLFCIYVKCWRDTVGDASTQVDYAAALCPAASGP